MIDNIEKKAASLKWQFGRFIDSLVVKLRFACVRVADWLDPGHLRHPEEDRMYTYLVSPETTKEAYAGGERGSAFVNVNTPFQVIDIVMGCKPKTFEITSLLIGDVNMMLSGGSISADYFAATQQNRFVRFTTCKVGQHILIQFVNKTKSKTAEALDITFKVRSTERV